MNKFIRYLTVAFFVTVICVSGNNLQEISGQYAAEHKIKNELSKYRPALPQAFAAKNAYAMGKAHNDALFNADFEINGQTGDAGIIVNQSVVDMQNSVNNDVVGWLYIPDTRIDYPVVAADDNEYYLRRDIYHHQSNAGSIFMDYRCKCGLSKFNTIIYGHSMKNKSMFGDLKLFGDPDFFNMHTRGALFTVDGAYMLDIFAYMVVGADDKLIYDPSAETDVFLEYVRRFARQYREPVPGNIVTLSTCAYEYDGARTVVLAALNRYK